MSIRILYQSVGKPKTYGPPDHEWLSAIGREPVTTPIQLNLGGLSGDAVADKRVHGSPDQAVCGHSIDHYAFWNDEYHLTGTPHELRPGAVGENWTLSNCDETTICIGDTFRVGTALVQVSQPRSPCWKQEAKTGLPNLVERTFETLKTGFYFRVLEPGSVCAGDKLVLQNHPHPALSIFAICNFRYHGIGQKIGQEAELAQELSPGFRDSISKKLRSSSQQ